MVFQPGQSGNPGGGSGARNRSVRMHIKAQDLAAVAKGRDILVKAGAKAPTDEECLSAWYKDLDNRDLCSLIGRRMPKNTTLEVEGKMTWAGLVASIAADALPMQSVTPVVIESKVIDAPAVLPSLSQPIATSHPESPSGNGAYINNRGDESDNNSQCPIEKNTARINRGESS